jgi:membrane-associated phospholipid phosphatase
MRFPAATFLLALFMPILAAGQNDQQQECVLSAPKICALHVLQDEEGIVASPARTRAKDFLWIAPFGLATGLALDYDAHAIRSLGIDKQRENQFETISNVGAIYGPIAASGAGYFVAHITHNDLMRETAVLSAEAMADATILNQGLKYAIDRQDPQQGDGTGRFWPHGPKTWPDGQSMPSEHAMNVWAFAHVVATQYNGPATKLLVYSVATTVSASRVIARQHFPSDVVVGSVFGYLIGGYVEHHRSREAGFFSLSSVATPNGHGLQLAYNFAH